MEQDYDLSSQLYLSELVKNYYRRRKFVSSSAFQSCMAVSENCYKKAVRVVICGVHLTEVKKIC